MICFANDTLTIVSRPSLSEACLDAAEDAERLMSYMSSNYLVANGTKTKMLIFRPGRGESQEMSITINGDKIIESEAEKLLGLFISNDLQWGVHIRQMVAALNQRIAMMKRLSYHIPGDCLRQLAHRLVLSKIRYGIAVYGTTRLSEQSPTTNLMHQLEVVVNDTMRLIEGKKRKDRISIESLREKTKLPSANQLTIQAILMEAWKIKHGHAEAIADLMTDLRERDIITRAIAQGHVEVPVGGKNTLGSFSHQSAKLWNDLPTDIKHEEVKNRARNKIRNYALSFP